MVPRPNFTRIDTLELKNVILKKIGPQRGESYFDQLRRWFTAKITKYEFDKYCIRTIGRENIPLHNKFIRSIIKNACVETVPPPKGIKTVGSKLNVKIATGCQRSSLQSLYGDAFPPSPRKGRSMVNRDRKFKDRPSPLGPSGKPQSVVAVEESVSKAQEQQSATELLSLGSRPPVEVASVEEGEEVEQVAGSPGIQSRSPVTAPLGISIKLSGARKSLSNIYMSDNYHPVTCQNSGELPDTRSLRSRLERKLETEGIGISVDCVNLLNNGLDAYLKRLIELCMGLARSQCRNQHPKQLIRRLIPGLDGMRYVQRPSPNPIYPSILDLWAAMELNPKVLGEDWPLQLERIRMHASEE